MYKTDYEKYVEWCKARGFDPVSEAEEKKYGIWNSIEHLGMADQNKEELV